MILWFAFNVNFVGGNQGWYKGRLKASRITFLSFFLKKPFYLASEYKPIPWWLRGKESACNSGDASLIPELGRSPGGGNGNPPKYSWKLMDSLGKLMDRRAWQTTAHGVAKSQRRLKRLCLHAKPMNDLVIVSGGQRRDSALHTRVHCPSHPGGRVTLSSVPCAARPALAGYPF